MPGRFRSTLGKGNPISSCSGSPGPGPSGTLFTWATPVSPCDRRPRRESAGKVRDQPAWLCLHRCACWSVPRTCCPSDGVCRIPDDSGFPEVSHADATEYSQGGVRLSYINIAEHYSNITQHIAVCLHARHRRGDTRITRALLNWAESPQGRTGYRFPIRRFSLALTAPVVSLFFEADERCGS